MSNETINLPTIVDIEAAAEVLSMPDNSAKVVRVKDGQIRQWYSTL
jgi:hypothetical protein